MSGETELRRHQTQLALLTWRELTVELSMLGGTYEDARRAAWLELDGDQRHLILEQHGVQA